MNKLELTVQGYPVYRQGYIPKTIQAQQSLVVWRNLNAEAPDAWLRAIICAAFAKMIRNRLDGMPASVVIQDVAEDWINDIGRGMEAELDRERVIAGFLRIFRECRRWPQPVDLLKRLPARIKPHDPRTTEAPVSDEAHARQAAELQKIMDGLK